MGILSCLEPQHRLAAAPDTPPELLSPTSSSSYSSSSSSSRPSPLADHQSWHSAAPISPPMSHYDHYSSAEMSSAGKSMEDNQRRNNDASQAASRTQLPSLSSLFPHPPARPANLSPALSERHAAVFHPVSVLDRPQLPPAHGSSSRPHQTQSSYYGQASPPPAPPEQPRSTYDYRYEHERPPSHSMTRTPSGHGSPKLDHFRHEASRDAGSNSSSSKWLPTAAAQDSRYPPLPSPHHDRPPIMPYAREPAAAPSYRREAGPLRGASANPPPTPISTVSEGGGGGVQSKDGLGPKIWTGTHFLPRFVRSATTPIEGPCYFYDDGSHCKTVIDGEPVNPHWGVTKAGKPRKRLAIACMTCREKKVKCDPDYPRCIQCQKFGRICRFKNA